MASAPLTISLGMTGAAAVQGAFTSLSKGIAGVGKAAGSAVTAPLKGLGSALGGIASIAGGVALGGALTQLPGQLLDMAKGAAADEQATARLQQTLRNLPGDFGKMSAAVDGAIAAGQKLAFSDDDVRDSFQALAVATGSSEEALSRQKIAMDLARGAGIPLSQASKLLSKVNEENVEAFKRLGITIGENATETEALAAVQAKFAGQAETFGASTAGQFEAATLAMGEIQESIGSALLPLLTAAAQALSTMLPVIQEWVGAFAGGIAEKIMPSIQPLLDMLPSIGTALSQAFSFFTTGGGDIEVFRGVLNKLVGPEGTQMVIEVFTNLAGFFKATVIPMFESFGNIVTKVMQGDFGGAIQAAGAHIARFGPELVATLAGWAKRFVEWVAPMIPPLLVELGKFGQQLLGWVAQQAPPIARQFVTEWVPAAINWIIQAAIDMSPHLAALLGKLGAWVIAEGPGLAKKFIAEWVPAAIGWVVEAGMKIAPKLVEFLAGIGTWVQNTGIPLMQAATLALGQGIIDGIVAGVKNFGPGLSKAVTDAASSAVQAAKDWLLSHSPSKRTRDELGIPMMQGIIQGIAVKGPALDNALSGVLTDAVIDAEKGTDRLGRTLREALAGSQMGRGLRNVGDLAGGLDDILDRVNRLNIAIPEMGNNLIGLPSLPPLPGGGGNNLQPLGAGGSGVNITINNTNDMRGMSQDEATRAVADPLAMQVKRYVMSGAF